MIDRFSIRVVSWMLGLMVSAYLGGQAVHAQGDASGEKIYKQTLRSTVWIIAPKGSRLASSGTGSLIDMKHKLVVTNYHVVGDSSQVIVLFPDYQKGNKLITERSHYMDLVRKRGSVPGKVLHRDMARDLAVIELETVPKGVEPLRLARDSAGPGQRVHSIGNPGRSDALWCYTSGTVRQVYHKKWRSQDEEKIYSFEAHVVETQSPTNSGDSGGPLVNDRGELVAVTQGTATNAQLISLFIDVSEVKSFLASKKLLPRLPAAVARADQVDSPKAEAAAGAAKETADKLEKAAASKLELAKTLANDGKLDKAKVRFETIISTYPDTKAAVEAKVLLDRINK
jgi:serine protease Do